MKASAQQAALDLVNSLGWYVFRLRISHDERKCDGGSANCKKVDFLDQHWPEVSSNDPEEVASWDWSRANSYGVDCGKSGIVVADRDPGDEWPFTGTRVHSTGRGEHYIYEDLVGFPNRTGLKPWGVDVRGDGGMIIGPGSYHPHGEGYRVLHDVPLLAAPAELAGPPSEARGVGTYEGLPYEELSPGLQAWADREQAARIEWWRTKMAEAAEWPEGYRDEAGRGWELLATHLAWALAKMAVCPWMRLDEDDAAMLFELLLGDLAAEEVCRSKWRDGLITKAAAAPVEPPQWDDFLALTTSVFGDDSPPALVDVTNESAALDWLKTEMGSGKLAGIFFRGGDLVHTPRIGERGYIESEGYVAGPAQVQRISAGAIAAVVDDGYQVVRGRVKAKPCMFPQTVANRAVEAPWLLRGVRPLTGVTHTPIMRRDGSVLDVPGYDPASGALYLPPDDLQVPRVSQAPSASEVRRARALLHGMVSDFPFVTPHDEANYLGALLTPLLRAMVPPPFKLLAIGAPQRGSGKSLLAWILRELHGGVFKSEFPENDEELRKFITSVLDRTTGPVVQLDNVTGVLKSSVLDGLLTSRSWSDRILGRSEMVTLDNDRLWVVTGNNVHIGGDLERRTMWVTINADVEHPEQRSGFAIADLEGWVRARRGELLWALLTLIRAWVVAGMVTGPQPTSDSFGRWVAVLRGVLAHAGIPGVVGHPDTMAVAKEDPQDVEWRMFLAAAHRAFGSEPWTTRELLERVSASVFDEELGVRTDELPGDLGERMEKTHVSVAGVARALGMWLSHRENRWAGGFVVKGLQIGDRAKQWRVLTRSDTRSS